jgi:hypothetical protein
MKTFIIHAEDNNIQKIKDFLNSLKVSFEVSKEENYNAAFVKKIKQGIVDKNNGLGRKVNLDEIKDLWK